MLVNLDLTLAPLGAILGCSWALLGPSCDPLGPPCAHLGSSWGLLGATIGPSWPAQWLSRSTSRPSKAISGPSGANLIVLGRQFGAVWAPSWASVGPVWSHAGAILGLTCAHSQAIWEGSPWESRSLCNHTCYQQIILALCLNEETFGNLSYLSLAIILQLIKRTASLALVQCGSIAALSCLTSSTHLIKKLSLEASCPRGASAGTRSANNPPPRNEVTEQSVLDLLSR